MTAPLTQKQKTLLEMFKKAIDKERDAQALYAEMYLNCDDQALKQTLDSLRAAEQDHEKMLLDKYKTLRQTEPFKDMRPNEAL